MYRGLTVGVAIPALDEEASIGFVVGDLRALRNDDDSPVIDDIVVCDNGSRDATGARAAEAGARVVRETRKGYGSACLAAIAALRPTDIVLFTDADHAFHAAQGPRLLDCIADGADLVIGSRALGGLERGAMSFSQVFGNRLATALIRWLWGQRVTDLGPYRAIRAPALSALGMRDATFGWTVEMQVKAIQQGMRVVEVPVDTRVRIGKSKISGTVRGVLGAGFGILSMIAKLRWQRREQRTVGEGLVPSRRLRARTQSPPRTARPTPCGIPGDRNAPVGRAVAPNATCITGEEDEDAKRG